MNRRSPTQLSKIYLGQGLHFSRRLSLTCVNTAEQDGRAPFSIATGDLEPRPVRNAKKSTFGCFPATASTRYGKRSIPTASHSRVFFAAKSGITQKLYITTSIYLTKVISLLLKVGLASACATVSCSSARSSELKSVRAINRLAPNYSDHEQRYYLNDVLTRSVDATLARTGLWRYQAVYPVRFFCNSLITYLQTFIAIYRAILAALICATKVSPKTALFLISRVFLIARATLIDDTFLTRPESSLLDSAFIAFMVAFQGKRSFPAPKSLISPMTLTGPFFLPPISASTAFPLVRGASACSSIPSRQVAPASRAFFLPTAMMRSLLNAHRSHAVPTHTRNTQ